MGFEWIALKNYKRHYICLDCKKGFKGPNKKEMKHAESDSLAFLMEAFYDSENEEDIVTFINKAFLKTKKICPNCARHMIQVHYDFEVPKTNDKKSWKLLERDLSRKQKVNYETYIQWHLLEIKKEKKGTEQYDILSENLHILKKEKRINRD